jgi:hypothetical protein
MIVLYFSKYPFIWIVSPTSVHRKCPFPSFCEVERSKSIGVPMRSPPAYECVSIGVFREDCFRRVGKYTRVRESVIHRRAERLFDDYIVFRQKSRCSWERKFCSRNSILLRVDLIVHRTSEVSTSQYRSGEYHSPQITESERYSGEIRSWEVDAVEMWVMKYAFCQIQFWEDREVEYTSFECCFEEEIIAFLEVDTEDLAVRKIHFLHASFESLHVAQVASDHATAEKSRVR